MTPFVTLLSFHWLWVLVWLIASTLPLEGSGAAWWATRGLLLAALVWLPLALDLVDPQRVPVGGPSRLRLLMRVAALALIVAFLIPGVAAAWAIDLSLPVRAAWLMALPWLMVTLLLGMRGGLRLLGHPRLTAPELCCDLGLLALPVGGFWLVADRAGMHPFGFGPPFVLLTAMHFHYVGCLVPIILGLSGRLIPRPGSGYRWLAPAASLGVWLVAIGIATGGWAEVLSTIGFTSLTTAAVLWLLRALMPAIGRTADWRLLASACLLGLLGLTLAMVYAISARIPLDTMAAVHGLLLGLGLVGGGLVVLARLAPAPRTEVNPPVLSALTGGWRIGADFLERRGWLGQGEPHGMLDNFLAFGRPDFPAHQVDPRVRDFYERTDRYDLDVTPDWQPGWSWAGQVYKRLSRRIEQMNFPSPSAGSATSTEAEEGQLESRILSVDASPDRRPGLRAWVRTYSDSHRAIYVAIYATLEHSGMTYMHITFPLPGGNLASVLRLDVVHDATGPEPLQLSTLPRDALDSGVQGVYLRVGPLHLRLPVNETITVWTADQAAHLNLRHPFKGDAPLLARHIVWILGQQALTLWYAMRPATQPPPENTYRPASLARAQGCS